MELSSQSGTTQLYQRGRHWEVAVVVVRQDHREIREYQELTAHKDFVALLVQWIMMESQAIWAFPDWLERPEQREPREPLDLKVQLAFLYSLLQTR